MKSLGSILQRRYTLSNKILITWLSVLSYGSSHAHDAYENSAQSCRSTQLAWRNLKCTKKFWKIFNFWLSLGRLRTQAMSAHSTICDTAKEVSEINLLVFKFSSGVRIKWKTNVMPSTHLATVSYPNRDNVCMYHDMCDTKEVAEIGVMVVEFLFGVLNVRHTDVMSSTHLSTMSSPNAKNFNQQYKMHCNGKGKWNQYLGGSISFNFSNCTRS